MKVKTLVAHDNSFGVPEQLSPVHKKVGSVYELPDADAQNLIDQKIVEKHASEKSSGN